MTDVQGLSQSFADDIALYHRVRPEYPTSLIDRLFLEVGDCHSKSAIEVGPGTGKLTQHLLAHGLEVTCFEPAKGFVDFLQHQFEGQGALSVICQKFEDSSPPSQEYDVVVSAQAFHWVTPISRGLDKAAECLKKQGVLALFWYRIFVPDSGIRRSLQGLYKDYPQVTAFLPGSGPSSRIDYVRHIQACTGFVDLKKETIAETVRFTSEEIGERLMTESQHKKLKDTERERLINNVRSLILGNGDSVDVVFDYSLYLCRKL